MYIYYCCGPQKDGFRRTHVLLRDLNEINPKNPKFILIFLIQCLVSQLCVQWLKLLYSYMEWFFGTDTSLPLNPWYSKDLLGISVEY
jgi:hypothetical protein